MKTVAHARITSTDTHYVHDIHAGRYDLKTDEPVALGGQGQGPAPFDLYLASLSACTAITLRMYAERKGWDLGEFRAELKAEMDDDGHLHVNRILHASGPLDEAQWQRLLEVVANTPVTKVMREGAAITSERGN
ncbi:OsmC family protein [Solilutibacter tolerans]|uniref:Putative redox protein n=1 Tax=Solilutibacter tolerans TaxID=1604334 RepID=A0A1N6QF26_9GAMM|nr:OsmC family protein [Lysobacter tolerans]SIQ15213.1 putative redox protein [Lysobacter tolerans]